jgi:release factor glutamine methyltransferase
VAYLTGRKDFHGLTLQVDARVLDPRDDTETLVDWALDLLPPGQPARVLDLGTGSGAIALAIAHARPAARVWAVDASADALAVAQGQRRAAGPADGSCATAHWFAPVAGASAFDAMVPATRPTSRRGMRTCRRCGTSRCRRWPVGARMGWTTCARIIAAGAPRTCVPGGWLLLEHGWDQAAACARPAGRLRASQAVGSRQ